MLLQGGKRGRGGGRKGKEGKRGEGSTVVIEGEEEGGLRLAKKGT